MKSKKNPMQEFIEIQDEVIAEQKQLIHFLEKDITERRKQFCLPWWGALWLAFLAVLMGYLIRSLF